MLPTSPYSEPLAAFSAGTTSQIATPGESTPVLLLAVASSDLAGFPSGPFTCLPAHTTVEAVRLIERTRPRMVVLDWDINELDGPTICRAACQKPHTRVVATMAAPAPAPAAIKAGAHAILLKPFAPNLVAARLGRLMREMPMTPAARRIASTLPPSTSNRTWPHTACPTCQKPGAVSFEFSSYRRSWYACLGCDAVWLGPRQE